MASDNGLPNVKNCSSAVSFTLGSDLPPMFYRRGTDVAISNFIWNITENAFSAGETFRDVSARDADLQVF